jgi:hypothetical protein
VRETDILMFYIVLYFPPAYPILPYNADFRLLPF